MKTETLKNLGLTEEQISEVMKENGKDVETTKAKYADYDDLKQQLSEAGKQIESFKSMDIEGIKKAADEWKQKAEQAQKDAAEKIAGMERLHAEQAFASSLKFSSAAAKKAFLSDLAEKKLPLQEGKLLGAEDFVKAYREADSSAFANETPPPQVILPTGNTITDKNDINTARAVMGLPPEK